MVEKFNISSVVFLPGMDGTGLLFAPLLKYLTEFSCKVITLPQSGAQDYLTLTSHVKEQLPNGNFVLIAESFSGPIAAQLVQQKIKNLKGVVFVATFLSSPNKTLLKLAKRMPIKILTKFPGAHYFIKKLLLGSHADKALIRQFLDSVNQVPTKVLKDRMQVLHTLKYAGFDNTLTVVYILPNFDKVVSLNKVPEFKNCFTNLIIHKIDGPHFILQTAPENSADIIIDYIQSLS